MKGLHALIERRRDVIQLHEICTQIDGKGSTCQRTGGLNSLHGEVDGIRPDRQNAEPAGIGHGGNQLRSRHTAHGPLNQRVIKTEGFNELMSTHISWLND